MAKAVLPTNFQDDIINASMGGKRRYNLIQNIDGTVSLEDVTDYDQVGSNFGAGQINQTNTAVNAAADAGKIIDDINDISAVTEGGYITGALVAKELKKSVADGKALIASAITSKGVSTASNASFGTMANNIKNINTAGIMSTSGKRNGNYTWYADKDYQGLVIAAYRSGSRAAISRAATYFNLLVESDQKLHAGIFVVSSKINKGESITVTATESYIVGNGA